jgi:hypothetical protein
MWLYTSSSKLAPRAGTPVFASSKRCHRAGFACPVTPEGAPRIRRQFDALTACGNGRSRAWMLDRARPASHARTPAEPNHAYCAAARVAVPQRGTTLWPRRPSWLSPPGANAAKSWSNLGRSPRASHLFSTAEPPRAGPPARVQNVKHPPVALAVRPQEHPCWREACALLGDGLARR